MLSNKPSISRRQEGGRGGAVVVLLVIIVIAALAWFLFFSGPGGGGKPSAKNLIAQSDIAVKGIAKESFTFDGQIETNAQGELLGIPFSGEGRIDSGNERMNFRLNIQTPRTAVGSTGSEGLEIETYAIKNTVYYHTNLADTWGKYQATGDLWGNARFSQKLVEFAANFDSTPAGKEVVNGRNCDKVVVTPTMEALLQLIKDVDPGMEGAIGDVGDTQGMGRGVKSIEMVIWVDSTEFVPVKTSLTMTVQTSSLNPGGSGVVPSELSISFTANFDYKTPFNIVLPSAAQSAVDVSAPVATE